MSYGVEIRGLMIYVDTPDEAIALANAAVALQDKDWKTSLQQRWRERLDLLRAKRERQRAEKRRAKLCR